MTVALLVGAGDAVRDRTRDDKLTAACAAHAPPRYLLHHPRAPSPAPPLPPAARRKREYMLCTTRTLRQPCTTRTTRDEENEEAQVTWAPCKAGQLSDDARHTLGLQQRVPVPAVYIGEYTSPAKAAPELTESRPKQCPRVGEPRHRGADKRVHSGPIGWRWWRQPFRRAQRRSRDIPREPPRHGGSSGRGRRPRWRSHASDTR